VEKDQANDLADKDYEEKEKKDENFEAQENSEEEEEDGRLRSTKK
jgi:hypothetical protein